MTHREALRWAILGLLMAFLVPAPVRAGDRPGEPMPALEELRAEMNRTQRVAGFGLVALGLAVTVYGGLGWADARDVEGAPEGRYALLALAGTATTICGFYVMDLGR